MQNHFFIIYLVYGFVYIYLGSLALTKKQDSESQNAFITALTFLGLFGLTHGISEWMNMILIQDVYPMFSNEILVYKQLLKATSFVFLGVFGLKLVTSKRLYRGGCIILSILFLFWCFGFSYWWIEPIRVTSDAYALYNTVFLRYGLAFFSAFISGIGLYQRSKILKQMNLEFISNQYVYFAVVFFVYAVIEGILVKEQAYFPANVINREMFVLIFKVPVQMLKIIVGILISFYLTTIVRTFNWEQKERLQQLAIADIKSQERQRMTLDIHDGIMQSIYAIGLKIETVIKMSDSSSSTVALVQIKSDLNQTLTMARNFITSNTLKTVDFPELTNQIDKIIDDFETDKSVKFHTKYESYPVLINKISTEKCTHLFYIVQEALVNVIKHAKAKNVYIELRANKEQIILNIKDDGIGIDLEQRREDSYGISLMRKRVDELNGSMELKRNHVGTELSVEIPWEDS